METIQANKVETLTINAAIFNDLLTGALVAADTSKAAMPRLGAIYLTANDDVLQVRSTDRYKMIAASVEVPGAYLDETMIRVEDAKRILAALKAAKNFGEVTLTKVADTLSVAIAGASLTIYAGGEKFPPADHLINKPLSKVDRIGFNSKFLADFSKVPTNNHKNFTITLEFTGENSLMRVLIPHDSITWIGALMPVRLDK